MQAPFHRCVNCNEVISHPICSDCLTTQFRMMVSEHDARLAQEIVSSPIDGGTVCLFCGESMGLCPHCFSKDVYLLLQQKNERIAQEFLNRFDFNLRKEFNRG